MLITNCPHCKKSNETTANETAKGAIVRVFGSDG